MPVVRRDISYDLKWEARSMYFDGLRDADVSSFTGISISSLKRLRTTDSLFRTFSIARGRPQLLTSREVEFLCDRVERKPEITTAKLRTELIDILSVEASLSTIARALNQEGYTKKMVEKWTLSFNKRERADFRTLINDQFCPEQLVFADETHDGLLELGRMPYWSIHGNHPCRYRISLRGKEYFILLALSLDGLLHLEVVENSITRDVFQDFVEGLLLRMNEWPLSNSVLVIDQASVHRVIGLREMVEERGARLVYLPDYSPDYNPVELSLPGLKTWLRVNQDRVDQALNSEEGTVYDLFWEAIHSITTENVKTWYKDHGYNVPE